MYRPLRWPKGAHRALGGLPFPNSSRTHSPVPAKEFRSASRAFLSSSSVIRVISMVVWPFSVKLRHPLSGKKCPFPAPGLSPPAALRRCPCFLAARCWHCPNCWKQAAGLLAPFRYRLCYFFVGFRLLWRLYLCCR